MLWYRKLQENSDTGGQQERGVKYGCFPVRTEDLTAMVCVWLWALKRKKNRPSQKLQAPTMYDIWDRPLVYTLNAEVKCQTTLY